MQKREIMGLIFNPLAQLNAVDALNLTCQDVLTKSGLTRRQLTHLIKNGAVDRPSGNTRAARYSAIHVAQAKFAAKQMRDGVATAAQLGDARLGKVTKKTGRVLKSQPSTECRQENVYQVTPEIRIVTAAALGPTERKILSRLRMTAKLTTAERYKLTNEICSIKSIKT